jgi:hypothetical protein
MRAKVRTTIGHTSTGTQYHIAAPHTADRSLEIVSKQHINVLLGFEILSDFVRSPQKLSRGLIIKVRIFIIGQKEKAFRKTYKKLILVNCFLTEVL